MINRVVLVGRLTRDPELRYTQGGAAVASFTLAVNRQFTNSQGEREADFINCVIWRKTAENFANFTNKGSLVGIDGHLQTRNYENKQGQRVYVTEVVVDNFSLLESRNANSSDSTNDNSNKAPNYNQSKNSNTNVSDPFVDNSKPIDISDSDLPF
ncbi:single-stranded DNA-binding protein [Companilactobacillus nodensis]|uniref:Single-stranded DNA-binding protein n=1 Tax=Companilactobacillus nodensis DSM 19682 = JCM 14932 = NBRC 107160 TaxID=1423775 RepID=A0A0R1KFG8_9LACO|nr:single-stranded DNA-binding protein [Companilactobacillus nodensis]KRK80259.1 single-strand DNA binding protein [Companilactobacillus nodensis DSM 19682 = JCM 14932 = NBRC 107160]